MLAMNHQASDPLSQIQVDYVFLSFPSYCFVVHFLSWITAGSPSIKTESRCPQVFRICCPHTFLPILQHFISVSGLLWSFTAKMVHRWAKGGLWVLGYLAHCKLRFIDSKAK